MSKTVHETMVEEFQCPGCVCGGDVSCGHYKPVAKPGEKNGGCDAHVLGTTIMGPGHFVKFALGLPKGFNRPTWCMRDGGPENQMFIRLWEKPEDAAGVWDRFNVPVWAMEREGHLFVRTVSPRVGWQFVDVIKGGTVEMVPQAIDVGQFHDEID